MERKHYWFIANAFAHIDNTPVKIETVLALVEVLKKDSKKFDADKFIDACGC